MDKDAILARMMAKLRVTKDAPRRHNLLKTGAAADIASQNNLASLPRSFAANFLSGKRLDDAKNNRGLQIPKPRGRYDHREGAGGFQAKGIEGAGMTKSID